MWKVVLALALLLALWTAAGSFGVYGFAIRRWPERKKAKKKKGPAPGGQYGEKLQLQQQMAAWLRAQPMLQEQQIESADGLRLQGYFLPAARPTGKTVLTVHGHRCDALREWGMFAYYYHSRGYNLLLPDNRAHGGSEGKRIGMGYLDRQDLLRWAQALIAGQGPGCEILLHGISMGAAAVLLTGAEEALPAQVKGIVADCGYTNAFEELGYRLRQSHLPPFPILQGADLLCRRFAGYSLRQADPLSAVKRIGVPVLFIHGDADTYVPTEMGYRLYEACRAPWRRIYIQRGAIHAASWVADQGAYAAQLDAFTKEIGF